LNCFHLIFPLWKTSVPMVVAKTGLSLNAIFTTLSSQQICETFNLIKPVCVCMYIYIGAIHNHWILLKVK
jgi:hypothetical protein